MPESLVLFAEDDDEDWMLFEEALGQQCPYSVGYERVRDGKALLQRLQDPEKALPDVVVLDLRMPRMDGRSTLRAIRANEVFRHLPVVMMTTSKLEADILDSYREGANSYIVKPVTFEEMGNLFRDLHHYWFTRVSLPRSG